VTERAIVPSLQEKVMEAIERVEHLVSLVPGDRVRWKPEMPGNVTPANDLGHTLGHLLDCMAGFCAVFRVAFAAEFADFDKLREALLHGSWSPEEASKGLRMIAGYIVRGFERCSDADLARKIPTVLVPQGETLLTLLLGNLEHLNNHKYQLFLYLKLAGVAVSSKDIYRFRG
jgi:DinB superfamily